ncbi:MAG: hypothetical protein B6D77_16290 [gamma proteobacterium symbiont of Ctena orbiculata]|nr:MAG: hypothetical protein B6D77_16290 [gamma proteobacterium symbiont of Ctena orbiculata]PVV22661.1 MAG: hypothetical protein B6D78_04645 [gamma proteobacterium symbiont of Ctena orbiculata]PVV25393.1 MAG: hypothetical protein B6D79_09340 [gamma proteobacterium symbiont of Ctena orbiculata]
MAVLGIITCEILELEFAQLLREDTEVRRISILQDAHSAHLIEQLQVQHEPRLHCLPHPHAFIPEPDGSLEVLVRVLAMGLHRNRRVLRDALAKSAQAMYSSIDALLLGYGLCGGALEDTSSQLDVDVPIFQPMDIDHPMDDCVALCLGGRERYYSEQCKTAGTYFLTPGWSRHWRRMLDSDSDELSQPGLKRLLSGYERALLVQTPVLANDEMQRRGDVFRQLTGLQLEIQEGTLTPLTEAWNAAKQALREQTLLNTTGGSG